MGTEKRLLIIIPCLNEEKTIGSVIKAIPKKLELVSEIDILVVDDGSSDKTAEIAESNGAICIRHSRNRGVGAAFRTGLNYARLGSYDFALNLDGDGQFDPKHVTHILEPLLACRADMVTASRFKDPKLVPDMPKIKQWGNRRIANLVSLLTRRKLYDVSCGFRAYNRELIGDLSLLGDFTYTHEVVLQAAFKGYMIAEVPVEVRGVREFGTSRVANDLWRYAKQTLSIIGSTMLSHRPFSSFAIVALVFFLVGGALGGFFFYHRITTGQFEPHLWAGFSAAYFLGIGLISLLFGQSAYMFTRLHAASKKEVDLILKKMENENRKNSK